MKRKILGVGLSLLVGAALVLVSCVPEVTPEVPPEVPEEVPKIGYITRLAVPWWIVCEAGFKAAAADFNFEPVIYHPEKLTVEDQVRVMETWIAMETDAILLGTNDPNAVIGIISQAIDAGIPVIAGVSNDAPDSDRLLFVGFGAPETGVSLAKALLAMLEL